MKALIIGYGSIGKRHARLLSSMGEVAVVTSQPNVEHRAYAALEDAIANFAPDYVVVCTITSEHGKCLQALRKLGYKGRVLVEKPLFSIAADGASPYPFSVHVAYNLRFHPVVTALSHAMQDKKTLSAHIYVGQHLSHWRPGRDAKDTYSAHKAQGGGVLRDLSHELDLVRHVFGEIEAFQAISARAGNVTVDSEDVVAFVMRCKRCPVVSLQMNYLDHVARREWIVNTPEASYKADLVQKTLAQNTEIVSIPAGPDDSYRDMHSAMLERDTHGVCTFDEGLALVKLIDTVSPL